MTSDRNDDRHADAVERARQAAPRTWALYEWALGLTVGDAPGQCPEAHRAHLESVTVGMGQCAHHAVPLARGAERSIRLTMTRMLRPWDLPDRLRPVVPCAWCGKSTGDVTAYTDGTEYFCTPECHSQYENDF